MPRSNRRSIFGSLPRFFTSPKHAERAQTPTPPPSPTPGSQHQPPAKPPAPVHPLSPYTYTWIICRCRSCKHLPLPWFTEHNPLEVAIEAALHLHARSAVHVVASSEGSRARAVALEEYHSTNEKIAQLSQYLASQGHFVELEDFKKRMRPPVLAYHALYCHHPPRTRLASIAASDSSFYTDPE